VLTETVIVAIIGGVVSLLLVFANAWAKRISARSFLGPDESELLTDNSILDIQRCSRAIGEELHDETRAVIRRRFEDTNDRLDQILRNQRAFAEEWRATMKPGAFSNTLRQMDQDLTTRAESQTTPPNLLGSGE
jgi:uncharacterized membrane protein